MEMGDRKRTTAMREWIVFALSLGLGAHVTLGLVLHDGQEWPAQTAGVYGVLISLAIYAVVQLFRSIWWIMRGESTDDGLE